jgi:ribosomal protein S18 acetylase RimI-like enzyme
MPSITLRTATPEDATFAYRVEDDAMRAYAEATWGRFDPGADPAAYCARFAADSSSNRIVEVDGRPAGLLRVTQHADHDFIHRLYLLSAERGRGVGSALLQQTVADAAARSLPVRLQVLLVNERARALYERFKFRETARDAERMYMTRMP